MEDLGTAMAKKGPSPSLLATLAPSRRPAPFGPSHLEGHGLGHLATQGSQTLSSFDGSLKALELRSATTPTSGLAVTALG